MIKISLVMPVYNAEKYLKRSIDSIINQTFKEFELILINDGSTDNSPKICDYYAMKDNRVKVIHKNNEGSGPSRNRGIIEAQGEYITFPDSDDVLESDMLEKLYNLYKLNDTDLVICAYNIIEENEKIIKKHQYPGIYIDKKIECQKKCIELLEKDVIRVPWNKLYITKIIKENHITFPSIRRAQDTVFNIRYLDKIDSILIVEDILYNYRIQSNGGLLNKLPQEYIEIEMEYYKLMKNLLQRWECYDEKFEQFLHNEFNRGLRIAIENIYNPKWGYKLTLRYKQIKKLLNLPLTRESIKYSKRTKSLYQYIMDLCIKNRCPIGVMFIVRTKIIIRYMWGKLV